MGCPAWEWFLLYLGICRSRCHSPSGRNRYQSIAHTIVQLLLGQGFQCDRLACSSILQRRTHQWLPASLTPKESSELGADHKNGGYYRDESRDWFCFAWRSKCTVKHIIAGAFSVMPQ